MNEELKNYELAFATASEEACSELLETLKRYGVEIAGEANVSKTKFSYPIKKESFGFFGSLYFSATPEQVNDLNKALKGNLKVLRFFILNKPLVKETVEKRPMRARRQVEPGKISEKAAPAGEKSGTLSNEALEKKLEEILK